MKKAETGIQLQGILKPRPEVCDIEELYFHRKGRMLLFDGYFNLFYIEKWKRYTNLERLYLSVRVKGFQKLLLFHDQMCVSAYRLNADCEQDYKVEFPLQEYEAGVYWFAFVQAQKAADWMLSGFYTGESRQCWDVVLGADICTFRRENYVERNLKLLTSCILNKKELQVSDHLWIYIVDNGRTLHACSPVQEAIGAPGGRAIVIPNKNAGGAGGFTRGMLEILQEKEEKQLTHVILMDDDAMPEPDLFVRIYGFLRIRKEEWKDITLGGTMLQEENPYVLHCSGEYWKKAIIKSPGRGVDLRWKKNAACKRMLDTANEKTYYSGWWCCCYSLNVVRENNLPLPIFLHHDDIEYGIRNRNYGVVFLNGISVWHRSTRIKQLPSNLYFDIRNNLIEAALHDPPGRAVCIIRRFLFARIAARLVIYRPQEIAMILKGCMDFLKGPQWLWSRNPEQIDKEVKNMQGCGIYPIWQDSICMFGRFFIECRRAVLDYQENMYQYTTRQAWEDYLNR